MMMPAMMNGDGKDGLASDSADAEIVPDTIRGLIIREEDRGDAAKNKMNKAILFFFIFSQFSVGWVFS